MSNRKSRSPERAKPMQSLGLLGILSVAALLAVGGWYAGFMFQGGFNTAVEQIFAPGRAQTRVDAANAPPPPPPMDFNR